MEDEGSKTIMSSVHLTPEEWHKINAILPDVSDLCSRIRVWPYMEYIPLNRVGFDVDKLKRVRVSQVCFRDAANYLDNARYALGQAVAVRKSFMAESKNEKDSHHVLADLRSRFYADYVALLLYSTAEHACTGIEKMLGLTLKSVPKPDYKLKRVANALKNRYPNEPITTAAEKFDGSPEREAIWKYRNDWVHNKPKRVETVLYDPPRQDFVLKNMGSWEMSLIGAKVGFDYTWEGLVSLLQSTLQETADFLGACATAWEHLYQGVNDEGESD